MVHYIATAARSHVGRVRSRNEDAVAERPGHGLVVVADGMGGHPAGHVASRLAVDAMLAAWDADPHDEVSAEPPEVEGLDAGERMMESVRFADRQIREEGHRHPDREGMGTTLTALQVDLHDGRWTVGHVGDSRAYLRRNGELRPVTRDHTWVQEQVEAGLLTPEQARVHPWANVLAQCLGVESPAEPEIHEGELRSGDVFLLCTDGLVAMLRDEEVEAILEARLPDGLAAAADGLVEAANERGGADNVTVALLGADLEGADGDRPTRGVSSGSSPG